VNRVEDFLEFVSGRRSVRKFLADPVPREWLNRIIEAACWAPSASNRQDWEFTVITSRAIMEQMGEFVRMRWKQILDLSNASTVTKELRRYTKNFSWFSKAPTLIVISAKKPESFLCHLLGDRVADVAGAKASAAMAAQNLMLAAYAAGLASCCLTGPLAAQEDFKELLGFGKRREIVCLIALGFPAEQPTTPSRRPVEKITRYVE
jgi:nitroreductase